MYLFWWHNIANSWAKCFFRCTCSICYDIRNISKWNIWKFVYPMIQQLKDTNTHIHANAFPISNTLTEFLPSGATLSNTFMLMHMFSLTQTYIYISTFSVSFISSGSIHVQTPIISNSSIIMASSLFIIQVGQQDWVPWSSLWLPAFQLQWF